MSLRYIFFYDGPLGMTIIRSFGSTSSTKEQESNSFAGFVGAMMIVFALLSMLWMALDPTSNKENLLVYAFEYFGGMIIAQGFGFRFTRRLSLKNEVASISSGLFFGAIAVAVQFLLSIVGASLSTTEGVWFVLLAPVAETMTFVVAIYELFKRYFPDELWTTYALASDMMFTAFHIWRYITNPNFIWIFIAILIGNTLFVWAYHITRNATAPIIGHLIVNIFAVGQETVNIILNALPIYIAMIIIVLVVYILINTFTGVRIPGLGKNE